MILQYQQLTGQRKMTVAWFDSKGMQSKENKIQPNGQTTSGQMDRRIGWQDERGTMNSIKYETTQLHQDLGTRVAFKW